MALALNDYAPPHVTPAPHPRTAPPHPLHGEVTQLNARAAARLIGEPKVRVPRSADARAACRLIGERAGPG